MLGRRGKSPESRVVPPDRSIMSRGTIVTWGFFLLEEVLFRDTGHVPSLVGRSRFVYTDDEM